MRHASVRHAMMPLMLCGYLLGPGLGAPRATGQGARAARVAPPRAAAATAAAAAEPGAAATARAPGEATPSARAAAPRPGGATGAGGSGAGTGGGASASCTITLTASTSTKIGTVGIVTFTTTLSNPTAAQIDFGLDTSYGMTAPVDLTAQLPDAAARDEAVEDVPLPRLGHQRERHLRGQRQHDHDRRAAERPPVRRRSRTNNASGLYGGFLVTGQYNSRAAQPPRSSSTRMGPTSGATTLRAATPAAPR